MDEGDAALWADLEARIGKPRSTWTVEDWSSASEVLVRQLRLTTAVLGRATEALERLTLAGGERPKLQTLTLAGADPGVRVNAAMHQLTKLLADPYGREAYVRITRNGSSRCKQLLSKHRGAMPVALGALALQLMAATKPAVRRAAGRPRKADDGETVRWIELFQRLERASGKRLKSPPVIARLLQQMGVAVDSPQWKKWIDERAYLMREERKRRQRLDGKKPG